MDAFAALADPVRRDLLRHLSRGPARVVDLAADHAISRPAISRHLRVLGEADLVAAEDRGRERHYSLTSEGLSPVHALLTELAPAPRFGERDLDGLDLEVRRSVRAHPATPVTRSTEETA